MCPSEYSQAARDGSECVTNGHRLQVLTVRAFGSQGDDLKHETP
jgi:hypothetical protein